MILDAAYSGQASSRFRPFCDLHQPTVEKTDAAVAGRYYHNSFTGKSSPLLYNFLFFIFLAHSCFTDQSCQLLVIP